MIITTLKKFLNEKVGYHFCQVTLLFWLLQKAVPYTKYKMKKNIWIFLSEALANPRKQANDPYGGSGPSLKTTGLAWPRELLGCSPRVVARYFRVLSTCFWHHIPYLILRLASPLHSRACLSLNSSSPASACLLYGLCTSLLYKRCCDDDPCESVERHAVGECVVGVCCSYFGPLLTDIHHCSEVFFKCSLHARTITLA